MLWCVGGGGKVSSVILAVKCFGRWGGGVVGQHTEREREREREREWGGGEVSRCDTGCQMFWYVCTALGQSRYNDSLPSYNWSGLVEGRGGGGGGLVSAIPDLCK